MSDKITPAEVLALLFPEPASAGNPTPAVTAFVRDPHGGLMLASVVPSRTLLETARVAGRCCVFRSIVTSDSGGS